MAASSARPRTHLFTVRVWLEDLGDGRVEWRGQVKHVLSGEARHFRDWATLAKHLSAMSSSNEGSGSDASVAMKENYRD